VVGVNTGKRFRFGQLRRSYLSVQVRLYDEDVA